MNKPHSDVSRVIRNTNQEERSSHISDLTMARSHLVKCPSSHGQKLRNALSQYVTLPFGMVLQRYTFSWAERSIQDDFNINLYYEFFFNSFDSADAAFDSFFLGNGVGRCYRVALA